jgi:undecaprenyl-diphosphatase
MSHITYLEASVVGLIQGVTELFPVSSLGHNVLIPALVGGSWAADLNVAKAESPYLAFVVGLHVATAVALLIYFWRDWVRIIGGFFSSIRDRHVETVDQKLAWMIILATIPVGLVGLKFEHTFRVLFGQPIRAAIFLMVNGVILFAGEKFRTKKSLAADAEAEAAERSGPGAAPSARAVGTAASGATVAPTTVSPATGGGGATLGAPPGGIGGLAGPSPRGGTERGSTVHPVAMHASGQRAVRQREAARAVESDKRVVTLGYVQGVIIGAAQILALLAGISRDGAVMVTGMFRGLSRQDAARFSFLLSTPVIFAAGALKVGDLFGPLGKGIHGQVLVASILSGVGAYLSVRFLVRYFQTRTLTPFAIYCLVFGLASVIYLSVK